MSEVPGHPFDLILRYLPDWAPGVILDVGANAGQSAKTYVRRFPAAQIHSFEPSPDSHAQLVEATAQHPNVTAHRLALGAGEAIMALTQARDSKLNRLMPRETAPRQAVDVRVRAGASVLADLGIGHVDFLKIDTEGHDLDVLRGFRPTLHAIDFIQVEAGMNAYNTTHVPFAKLVGFLARHGFLLAYLFEQKMEWRQGGQPVLRRCNPLFVNARLTNLSGAR